MIENRVIVFNGDLQKNNCEFYMKMGACRHGTNCTKVHVKPLTSRTVVLKHLYLNPKFVYDVTTETYFYSKHLTEQEIQEHFDNIFEDIFVECVDQFNDEKVAEKAVKSLNNRWFGGRPVYAELSPVIRFHFAYCRGLTSQKCPKDNMCNFWHAKKISDRLHRERSRSKSRLSRRYRSRSRSMSKYSRRRSKSKSRRNYKRSDSFSSSSSRTSSRSKSK
ncbi:hypothetical protein O3M35_006764 [Rhynocoris fuscipes]|uniref:C3H1-type domain-containing protein n=1 Tax=Rhynocoris fuscipes TaxID=488301 RepID=A0AAW1DHC1_9HEMI